jgi:DNA-binding transcriptional LysR family regulator
VGGATWLGPVELDLESLRSFITVSAEGSLARAAPLLFVSTSGLSRRIHELEKKLGVVLLERSMHGVVLTPAGEQILLHAQKILQACDELYAAARESVTGPGGRRVVHVGIAPGVESPTRNRIVAAVTGAGPDAAVALDPDANMHLIRKLIVGELDLAILHQRPISPSVRSFQIGSNRTLVCLARHLPQASFTTLSLTDLNNLPFVTSSALNAGTPVYYAQLRSIFEEAGINRVVDVGAFNLYALQQHIAGGSGFGITFDSDEGEWDNAVIRTVADLELRRGTWVAWDRKAADDPALVAALAQLHEEYSAAVAADADSTMLAAGADASLAGLMVRPRQPPPSQPGPAGPAGGRTARQGAGR